MSAIHENAFEDEICEYLAASGWLYSPTDAGYDKARAMFPDDIFTWLQETQPAELSGPRSSSRPCRPSSGRRRKTSCSTG